MKIFLFNINYFYYYFYHCYYYYYFEFLKCSFEKQNSDVSICQQMMPAFFLFNLLQIGYLTIV